MTTSTKREKRRLYNARYRKSEKGRASRKRWAASAAGKAARARYRATEAGKLVHAKGNLTPGARARKDRYRKSEKGRANEARRLRRDPEKVKARLALHNALIAGTVERAPACSACGQPGQLHGHHHDYMKPLDVRWLCRRCHVDEHRKDH